MGFGQSKPPPPAPSYPYGRSSYATSSGVSASSSPYTASTVYIYSGSGIASSPSYSTTTPRTYQSSTTASTYGRTAVATNPYASVNYGTSKPVSSKATIPSNVLDAKMNSTNNHNTSKTTNLENKIRKRCKFWAEGCKFSDEDCNHVHPTERCRSQPNCRFGDKCIYLHDNDPVPPVRTTVKPRNGQNNKINTWTASKPAVKENDNTTQRQPKRKGVAGQLDEMRKNMQEIHSAFQCLTCAEVKEIHLCLTCSAPTLCTDCIQSQARELRLYKEGGKYGHGTAFCPHASCGAAWTLRGNSASGVTQIKGEFANLRQKLYSAGVRPEVCEQAITVFTFIEGRRVESLITPDVLAFLLFAFFKANASARREAILGSYGTTSDVAELANLETTIPCPREIVGSSEKYVQFRRANESVAKFIEWLVCSNRSYLVRVPDVKRVDTRFLQTDKQYLFVSDTPAKQREFERLVKQAGRTRFLFHGSRIENWHAIIRNGLKNLSGTSHQLNGNVYGNGIYLSPYLNTSLGYSNSGGTNCRPSCARNGCCLYTNSPENLHIVALVEVVDTPDAYTSPTDGVVVVRSDKWCSIRMLLLYPSSLMQSGYSSSLGSFTQNGMCNLDNISTATRQQIAQVVSLHKS